MPSTYTDLGFEMQAAGEGTNVWGAPKLNAVISRINYAIAGYLSIALTGNYTMTSSNSSTTPSDFSGRNSLLKWTGTLSANATVTVPSVPMQWMMYNATNKTLTFTTGAGTTAVVETGDTIPIYSDGTNVRTLGYGSYNLKDYIAAQVLSGSASYPSIVGNAGKYLYTDGASALWRQPASTDLSDYETAIKGLALAFSVAL